MVAIWYSLPILIKFNSKFNIWYSRPISIKFNSKFKIIKNPILIKLNSKFRTNEKMYPSVGGYTLNKKGS